MASESDSVVIPTTVRPITSVPEALETVQGDLRKFFGKQEWRYHKFPFGLWFRGHSRECMTLQPRAFRPKIKLTDQDHGWWDETNVYELLRLRVPLQRRIYQSAFDWLCLMQHYSLPTRLLDWSESILPALYFAAREDTDEDGALIVLNAKRLNRQSKSHPTISTPSDGHVIIRAEMATTRSASTLCRKTTVQTARAEEGIKDKKGWLQAFCKPIAVFPNRLNDRMTYQYSVFTLHGGKEYVPHMKQEYKNDLMPPSINLIDLDNGCPADQRLLQRYTIPGGKAKERILEELFVLGIHEGTLFPEVERQASYLRKLWWYTEAEQSE